MEVILKAWETFKGIFDRNDDCPECKKFTFVSPKILLNDEGSDTLSYADDGCKCGPGCDCEFEEYAYQTSFSDSGMSLFG